MHPRFIGNSVCCMSVTVFYTEEGSFDQLKHLSIFASSLRCGAKISVFLSYLEGRGRIYSPWGVDSMESRIWFYVWSPRGTSLQGGEVHIHFFGGISMCGHLAGLHYRVGKFIYDSCWGISMCVSSDRHRRDTVRDFLTRWGGTVHKRRRTPDRLLYARNRDSRHSHVSMHKCPSVFECVACTSVTRVGSMGVIERTPRGTPRGKSLPGGDTFYTSLLWWDSSEGIFRRSLVDPRGEILSMLLRYACG